MNVTTTHPAPGLTDLRALLAALDPQVDPVPKHFLHLPHAQARAWVDEAMMMFREAEGTTLIVDAAGNTLQTDLPRWARIVLNVPSSLVAVGMMAEVSAALAQRGIPCNPVSAFLHDHVFVPWDCRHNAHEALSQLSH